MSLTEIIAREPRVAHLYKMPSVWLQRVIQRQNLACLDARLLRDLGLTRSEALAESSKWFWQA